MAANTTIFAALGVPDTDYAFLRTYGQDVIYDVTGQILGDHNGNMVDVTSFFVERQTKNHSEKYKLPGVGRLQRRGRMSSTAAVKATGDWTTSYPLEDFGASLQIDDVSFAYMTLQDYDLHLGTILKQDMNSHRYEILRALFNNTSRTFQDENWGALTVVPLANGDSVLYPPIVGAEVNATAQNYLGVAASAVAFTDTNDPTPTLVNTLEQHFGTPTGGSKIVVLCNNAQTTYFQGLSNFDTVPNRFVEYGANVSLVTEMKFPDGSPILGRYLGETDSAIIMEWRWIPANYLVAIHLDAPKPLIRRVDPPETGLGEGLQMIVEDVASPIWKSSWRDRFGYGVGNRLNGVVMDLTASGGANTYTIPSIYS
jgi:hypothetical protein